VREREPGLIPNVEVDSSLVYERATIHIEEIVRAVDLANGVEELNLIKRIFSMPRGHSSGNAGDLINTWAHQVASHGSEGPEALACEGEVEGVCLSGNGNKQ
jgi:hypothetical protein